MIDHGAFDFAFQAFRAFLELGQASQDDFQSTTGLARFDHIDVERVEGLGLFGHGFRQRTTAFDVVDDAQQ